MRTKLLISATILASGTAVAGAVIWHRTASHPAVAQVQGKAVASPVKGSPPKLPSERTPSQFPGGIDISLSGDALMLLTDPAGRRTGSDVLSGHSFAESPDASAGDDSIDDPNDNSDHPVNIRSKNLEISPVANGTYILAVQSVKKGVYDLDLHALSSGFKDSQITLRDVEIPAGARHVYLLKGDVANGGSLEISGGFRGSAAAATNGDRLLSYASPTASETQVPGGAQTFSLVVCYDSRARADSFSAELDGKPVSGMFHPAPGKLEKIEVPLHPGRNQLVLSISGDSTNGTVTTRDQLELVSSNLERAK